MSLDDERQRYWDVQAQLERRIDRHEDALERLETVPGALAELKTELLRRLDAQDRVQVDLARTLQTLTNDVQNMRTVTNDMRDAQVAGRVLTGIVKWTAAMIVAIGVIWGAVSVVLHPQGLPPAQK